MPMSEARASQPPVTFREGSPDDAEACAAILNDWIDATDWMPRVHPHEDVPRYFREDLFPAARVWVAQRGDRIEGFLAQRDGLIAALYLAPPARGQGVGRGLLDRAKAASNALELWTFVANSGAQRFYAREGFAEVRRTDGENEEGLPDILYRWQR
jgi:putative acetyltransferase